MITSPFPHAGQKPGCKLKAFWSWPALREDIAFDSVLSYMHTCNKINVSKHQWAC